MNRALRWMREELFNGFGNSLPTLIPIALLLWMLPKLRHVAIQPVD